ncbi:MAG: competence protein ComEC [Francisella sp.]|jgi:competence protein ComEC
MLPLISKPKSKRIIYSFCCFAIKNIYKLVLFVNTLFKCYKSLEIIKLKVSHIVVGFLKNLKYLFLIIAMLILSSCNNCQNIENHKLNKNIILNGVVVSVTSHDDGVYKFIFHSHKYGDILLTADSNYIRYLTPANKLQLKAKIYKPHEYENIDAFDYANYLENQNISAIGYVLKGSKISFKGTSVWYLPQRLRYYLSGYIQHQLADNQAKPLALALLIGEKDFSDSQKQLFLESGTSHLMVISGLHVGLLALIAFVIARFAWSLSPRLCRKLPAQNIAVVFSITIALIYSLLAGFGLPTQRALIMLSVVGVFWFLRKKVSILRSLVIAFVLILLFDFNAISSAGLWLSFSAVLFLVFVGVLMQSSSKWFVTLITQLYLSILLIPVSVYFFGGFSAISVVANIVAIPLVSFIIVPLLLLCLALSFIGIHLWMLPSLFLAGLERYLQFLVSHVGLVEYWSYFSFVSLILVVLGLFLVLLPISKSLRFLGLGLCLVFFQSSENISKENKDFNIHIFDTDSDMVLVQNQGKSLLYISDSGLNDKFTMTNSLSAYLKYAGIHQLDDLIITGSNDNDIDISMLQSVLPIENIITNLSNNLSAKDCNYSNSFDLLDARIRLFGLGKSCFVSIDKSKEKILLLGNISKKQLIEFERAYSRMLSPNILVSSSEIENKFLKDIPLNYFVYNSEEFFDSEYFKVLKNLNIKAMDTYNNGAISINLNKDNELSIYSQLKDF